MRKKSLVALVLLAVLLMSYAAGCFSYSGGNYGPPKVNTKPFHENASRTMSLPASIYYEKAFGNWIGQMIGNILGLPTEGRFIQAPDPEYAAYYPDVPEGAFTDDDTSMEWVFLHMLEEHGLGIAYHQVREEWMGHINQAIWVANARARELMGQGYLPPETGSKENNENWGAIDAQIECELFGILNPGLGDRAYKMAKWFASVTNDDYAVEAAAFYATMFSSAFFESDISAIVEMALTKIPENSLTWEVVSDVIEWHTDYPDWKTTRQRIWEKYGTYGWVSSPLNLASVVMAVLYGNGDFDLSLMIAVAAGWDNDCNAATTGGLLGTIVGESGIHGRWKQPLMNLYRNTNRDNLPSDTISNIASRTQVMAEKAILASGGAITEDGPERLYIIQTDLPWVKLPSNPLSDENLARRWSSTPICFDRSFTPDFPARLRILNDGIVSDLSLRVLRSQNVTGGDWWGYTFGDTLTFSRVVYYQGEDLGEGGWRTAPAVQYRDKMGRWLDVAGLRVTPADDLVGGKQHVPYARFVLDFDAAHGTGIRIFGKPRITGGYTSVTELEIFHGGSDGETPPTPPAQLKTTMLGDKGALLEWTDTSNNEHGFRVKRREFFQVEYEEIAVLGTSIASYVDSGVPLFRLCYYQVVAMNNAGSSEASNEASVFTFASIPLSVQGYILALILIAAVAIPVIIKTRRSRTKLAH